MCLISKAAKPIRAKENIIVYKIFKEQFVPGCNIILVTPFTYNHYNMNKRVLKANFKKLIYSNYRSYLKSILKYYLFRKGYRSSVKFCDNTHTYGIVDGFFHSYNNLELATNQASELNCEIYKCIIPKNTFYYKGINNDLASRKLKIIEKCV